MIPYLVLNNVAFYQITIYHKSEKDINECLRFVPEGKSHNENALLFDSWRANSVSEGQKTWNQEGKEGKND